jgi:hypothetical protein
MTQAWTLQSTNKGWLQKDFRKFMELTTRRRLRLSSNYIDQGSSGTCHFYLELHQMDVVTALLNGDPNETIHIEQPEGFVKPENAENVCRLRTAL